MMPRAQVVAAETHVKGQVAQTYGAGKSVSDVAATADPAYRK